MDYLTKAIRALVGSDDFAYSGEDYASIVWITEPTKIPTAKQVADKIAELEQADAAAIVAKQAQKQDILDRLGITAEEAKILLA